MKINIKDIEFEAFGGHVKAGGQHSNKHMNCVRAKHIPTGIVVTASKQRSLTQNKKAALEELQKRVNTLEDNKLKKILKDRYDEKSSGGFGSGDVVRTYRLVGNAQGVTDHQTGLSGSTDVLFKGELDKFIEERLK